jgi:hypothetical protein
VNPVHNFTFYFFKVHFNIISHLHLGLPSGFFPANFQTETLYAFFFSLVYATCPACLIILDVINLIVVGEEYFEASLYVKRVKS